jgi:hypothetical protein
MTFWVESIVVYFLPIASIILLVKTPSPVVRLAIIGIFHVFTSLVLLKFTSAKKIEVFAVTAA